MCRSIAEGGRRCPCSRGYHPPVIPSARVPRKVKSSKKPSAAKPKAEKPQPKPKRSDSLIVPKGLKKKYVNRAKKSYDLTFTAHLKNEAKKAVKRKKREAKRAVKRKVRKTLRKMNPVRAVKRRVKRKVRRWFR